jgi:hypothetical protein
MRNRLLFAFAAALLLATLAGPAVSAGAGGARGRRPGTAPSSARGPVASASGLSGHRPTVVSGATPGAPITGVSWRGINDPSLTPADPNGAIGPVSYVEIINEMLGIYRRDGSLVASATLKTLTGDNNFLGDPMVLWDPHTNRFYFNVWDINLQTMQWGFSKSANPTSIPGSFCTYSANFGYATIEFPDYPKLGQTKDFLLIGVNHYPTSSSLTADRSDLLWINKPQQSGPITTCPAASTFQNGKFTDLRNEDGTQAFTPVPAIQDDPSRIGVVLTSSDIECPGICGTGNLITVHVVRPTPGNPTVPQVMVTGQSIIVPTYAPPATNAPQKGTSNLLESLDGRLTHAVSAFDPRIGKVVVWTGHTVASGAKAEFRWYEVDISTPIAPVVAQSGVVKHTSLWVLNGAVAPDRTVRPSGTAHGDSMVVGFTTTSSTTFPAVQMVSKIGAGAQSAFVLVFQSTTFDSDFSCSSLPYNCRWGDYAGATSDPAASLSATHGEVWLTNQWTDGGNQTWNWEAAP